jgi:hypothetical protein
MPCCSHAGRAARYREDALVAELLDLPACNRPGLDLLPDIGPVLVVCFTNHALDAFLSGLLHAGKRPCSV